MRMVLTIVYQIDDGRRPRARISVWSIAFLLGDYDHVIVLQHST